MTPNSLSPEVVERAARALDAMWEQAPDAFISNEDLARAALTAAGLPDRLRGAFFFEAVGAWYDEIMAKPLVDGAHEITQVDAGKLASKVTAFWPEVRAALTPKEDAE